LVKLKPDVHEATVFCLSLIGNYTGTLADHL
jgi:hypothetical protein